MWPFSRRSPPAAPADDPAAWIEALASDDGMVHQRARAGLVRAGAVDRLRAALADPRPRLRVRALSAITELRPPDLAALLAAALEDPDPQVRQEALFRGGVAGLAARSPEAVASLGRLGAAADPALVAFLSHPRPQIRRAAAEAVGFRPQDPPGGDLLAALRAAVADPDPGVRAAALGTLGASDDDRPALERALLDPDPQVRQIAAETLGRHRVRAALPALIAALADGSWAAARALGQIGGAEVQAPLRAALVDDRVAGVAAEALGALGDPAAIPAVRALVARLRPEPQPMGAPDDLAVARAALAALERRSLSS